MKVSLLKSKIHKARITECEIDYEGSLEINSDYMDIVGIRPYEKILVVNSTNGERLETYAIPGPAGAPEFKLNGAAARKGAVGDTIIVMSFGLYEESEAENRKPRIMVLDEKNQIVAKKGSLAE
ncbi:MAG: aspartate 1-decarboxylase [Kiritimatiellaeota bacterium]|nr:aspartate 1-decarboxylase [Kiritimatiellota bacterium]